MQNQSGPQGKRDTDCWCLCIQPRHFDAIFFFVAFGGGCRGKSRDEWQRCNVFCLAGTRVEFLRDQQHGNEAPKDFISSPAAFGCELYIGRARAAKRYAERVWIAICKRRGVEFIRHVSRVASRCDNSGQPRRQWWSHLYQQHNRSLHQECGV